MMIRLDQLPSWKEHRLDFAPRENFILTNASVTTHGNKIFATVHATDHYMDDRGVWLPINAPESRCRFADNLIYIAKFSDDLELGYVAEVNNDALTPSPPWPFRGFEGSRLFSWQSRLWAGLATSGISPCAGDEFYMGCIAPAVPSMLQNSDSLTHTFIDLKRLAMYGSGKNWMPHIIRDRLWFHYWPGTLIGPNGERRSLDTSKEFAELHGGSQVIPFEGGGLAVVHDYTSVPGTFRRATRQYFMRFDADGAPTGVTPFRCHPNAQLEITTGMALHPDGQRLLISYGRDEADYYMPRQECAFIATVNIDEVRGLI